MPEPNSEHVHGMTAQMGDGDDDYCTITMMLRAVMEIGAGCKLVCDVWRLVMMMIDGTWVLWTFQLSLTPRPPTCE